MIILTPVSLLLAVPLWYTWTFLGLLFLSLTVIFSSLFSLICSLWFQVFPDYSWLHVCIFPLFLLFLRPCTLNTLMFRIFKLQFVFLLSLGIISVSDSVGVTQTDRFVNKLNFKKHVVGLFQKAGRQFNALPQIHKYIGFQRMKM